MRNSGTDIPPDGLPAAVVKLIEGGFYPVPVPYREKGPKLPGWQKLRLSKKDVPQYFNGRPQNVGVLLGIGGWADVDLDCTEAAVAADELLPPTGLEFGHGTKRRTHRLYRIDGGKGIPTLQFRDPSDHDKKNVLVELRSLKKDGSVGMQTVLPPSVHPSGERIRYDNSGEPATVDGENLAYRVKQTAAAALLARHFPGDGARNECFLALSGALARNGVPVEEALSVCRAIYRVLWGAAADFNRATAEVRSTYDKCHAGERVTGHTRLCELMPATAVQQALASLGSAGGSETHTEVTATPSVLPSICLHAPKRDTLVRECIQALRGRNGAKPQLFTRDRSMVYVAKDNKGRVGITEVEEDFLLGELERAADFYKITKKGERADAWPTLAMASGILARPQAEWGLPGLEGVVTGPVLRRDGSLLTTPGYDAGLRLYYAPQPKLVLPEISAAPSQDECKAAVAIIDEVIGDFPWVSEADRANYMALLLTPPERYVVGNVPIALIDSPKKGNGKTLLTEILARVHEGRQPSLWNPPANQDNWEKIITTVLLSGQPITIFDNLENTLQSPTLSAVVTSGEHADRKFHTQQDMRIPNRTLFVFTGNNIKLAGDIGRRCYRIRIDAKSSRPWEGRKFRHPDLKGYVIAQRPQILAALLTMVRGWVAADRPRLKTNVLGGGFERWSLNVGRILAYAKVDGFLSNQEELYEETDIAESQWEKLLDALRGKYPCGFQIRDLTGDLEHGDFPKDVLPEERAFAAKAGKYDGVSIAGAFRRKIDTRFGTNGLYLTNEPQSGTGALWHVEGEAEQTNNVGS